MPWCVQSLPSCGRLCPRASDLRGWNQEEASGTKHTKPSVCLLVKHQLLRQQPPGGGRGPGRGGRGVTAHKAASLVCVSTSRGRHPGASERATRPKGQPFTLRKRLQPLGLLFSNCNSFYFFLPMPEFGDRIIKSFQELLLLSFGCAKRLAGS